MTYIPTHQLVEPERRLALGSDGGVIRIPNWLHKKVNGSQSAFHVDRDEPSFCGTSGGRTSALLAVLLEYYNRADCALHLDFNNTGREYEPTYVFLHRLEQRLRTPLIWLEYVAPPTGYAPKESTFRFVSFETAARKGEPFQALLASLASYRAVQKGLGPVTPNPTQRICTAYLKYKVARKYINSLGPESWVRLIGIRADEAHRIAKLSARDDTSFCTHRAPLAEAGLTKEDVNRFWSEQDFTLELPEQLGNCTLCMLKDYSDLAHNMYAELTNEDTQWWLDMENQYGTFLNGGWTLDKLKSTAASRFEIIRPALQAGTDPVNDGSISTRDFKLITRQEARVLKHGLVRTPCMCESAELLEIE